MSTIAGQTIQAQMILRCLRRASSAWEVCTQWLLCHHPPEGTSNVSIRINLHWGFLFVCQSIIIIPSCRWQIQAPSHLLYKSLFTSCWIVNIVFLLKVWHSTMNREWAKHVTVLEMGNIQQSPSPRTAETPLFLLAGRQEIYFTFRGPFGYHALFNIKKGSEIWSVPMTHSFKQD